MPKSVSIVLMLTAFELMDVAIVAVRTVQKQSVQKLKPLKTHSVSFHESPVHSFSFKIAF